MSAPDDILAFSQTRSLWQQDLIRRIHCQISLSASDVVQAPQHLKEEHGLVAMEAFGEGVAPDPKPLTSSDIPALTAASTDSTTLISVTDVRNANKLAGNQILPFACKGITLIFGFNGSGKSGYGRILKRACRSREDKQTRMYGNVYAAGTTLPASAVIHFEEGPNVQSFSWQDGVPSSASLARISVFDAETAPLYANQQNKIEFLPRGLDVLPRLGSTCEELQRKIDLEIASITASVGDNLHGFGSKTYEDLMNRLALTTTEANLLTDAGIEAASVWNKGWDDKTAQNESRIRNLSEPAAKAAKLNRLKAALDSVVDRLSLNLNKLSVESYLAYRLNYGTCQEARENARSATAGRFASDPFGSSLGSSQWKKLYATARDFSAIVYQDKPFPFAGLDALCVLCQQPLGNEARSRFERFQMFVEDLSQRHFEEASAGLRMEIESLRALKWPTEEGLTESLAEYVAEATDGSELVSAGLNCLRDISAAKAAALCILESGSFDDTFVGVNPTAITKLGSAAACLKVQIDELEAASQDSAALANLKAEHIELLDRRTFASLKSVLLSRRQNLLHILVLRKCRTACDTRAISVQSSTMREKYLTSDFKQKVESEIENLGLDYLPVKVEGKTTHGASMIGVTLDKLAKVCTADILSEGEFRALALACFLAEVSMIDQHDGIIIDDPVSSLDHMHTTQIAKRLVEEAIGGRQVIIFTHDLPFYAAVMSSAAENRVELYSNWIQQCNGDFGLVTSDDSPWEAKNLNQRIVVLEKAVANMPDVHTLPREEFMTKVKTFYALLRETWERLVEERLLSNVVERYELGVKTQSLKCVQVTDSDFTRVHFGMTKASTYSGHDRARGMQAAVPTVTEMKADLEKIRSYAKELKSRNAVLEGERKKLLDPMPAELVHDGIGRDALVALAAATGTPH